MATFFYLPSSTSPTRHQSDGGRFHAGKNIWFGSIATIWAMLCTGFWWEFGSCRCCCRLLSCPFFTSKKISRHAIRGASLQQPFFSPNKKAVLFLFCEKTFLYSFFVQLRNVPELLPKIFWQSSTSPRLLLSDKKFRSAEEEGEGEQQGSDQLWLSSKKPFPPCSFPPTATPNIVHFAPSFLLSTN